MKHTFTIAIYIKYKQATFFVRVLVFAPIDIPNLMETTSQCSKKKICNNSISYICTADSIDGTATLMELEWFNKLSQNGENFVKDDLQPHTASSKHV